MPSSNKDSNHHNKLQSGHHYEELAALFFEQNGYRILEQNWRHGKKEIDLIVTKDNLLVFVEVKSTSTSQFGHPSEKIDRQKIINITETARHYLLDNNIENYDLRFDVVTFIRGKLEHYPGAFEAID